MLLLNLARIRAAEEHFEHVYPPETFNDERESFVVRTPAALVFDVYKDKDQFRLVGGVKTTVELPCSRCLESFTLPIDAEFDLRYQPRAPSASQKSGEAEREIEEDDFATAFYENDTIDLGQLMREQFYLSLSMKPLCREDCRGLCPTCGTNLNRSTCDCKRDWDDPRFAALKRVELKNIH